MTFMHRSNGSFRISQNSDGKKTQIAKLVSYSDSEWYLCSSIPEMNFVCHLENFSYSDSAVATSTRLCQLRSWCDSLWVMFHILPMMLFAIFEKRSLPWHHLPCPCLLEGVCCSVPGGLRAALPGPPRALTSSLPQRLDCYSVLGVDKMF